MHAMISRGLILGLLLSGMVLAQSQTGQPQPTQSTSSQPSSGQSSSGQSSSGQSSSGQSLADLARASRANKQAQEASGVTPKVITNQDLPENSAAGIPDASTGEPMTEVSGVQKQNRYADQRLNNRLQAEARMSAEWRTRIQEQEGRIADLQARIDRVNESLVAAIGTASYDTPANRYQVIQAERLSNLREQLSQQQRRLAAMQDAARRAGAGQ